MDFLNVAASSGSTCRVLVHCQYGRSRSASVAVAYVMKDKGVSLDRAMSFVAGHRPCLLINPGFVQQLRLLEAAFAFNRLPHAKQVSACNVLEVMLQRSATGDLSPVRLDHPKLVEVLSESPTVLRLLEACGFRKKEHPDKGAVLQPTDGSIHRLLCTQAFSLLRSDVCQQ